MMIVRGWRTEQVSSLGLVVCVSMLLAACNCNPPPHTNGNPSASAGDAGVCESVPGATCSGDELCFAKTCSDVSTWPLAAHNGGKACDLLVSLPSGGRFIRAEWAQGVLGHAEVRGEFVGIAIMSETDAELPPQVLALAVTGKTAPKVDRATCFDDYGNAVDMPGLEVLQ